MMKFREMSLWYKLSIVAAALVGDLVTRYAALVIMAGGHFSHRWLNIAGCYSRKRRKPATSCKGVSRV